MNSGTITKIVSTLAVSAFLSAMAPAQSPSLKGHVVGETVQQFLATSGDMAGRVATCRNAKDKKSARKFDLDLEFCQQLVAAFDDRGAISVTTLMPPPVQYPVHYLEFDGQVDFFDGKLASIQANLMDPWETVYQDLITSFGPPKSTGQATFQNDYGATLYGSNATWSFQDFSVTAEEEVMNSEFPPEMYLERVQAIARGKLSGKYRMVVVSIVGKDAIAGREAVTAQRKSTLQ